ncbi:MAG: mobile mystery protein B [Methylovirgula sp.]|uniref:mobile mystery protein B n=1 Tax=Methylovirgula sp. TaxID=1978224 RepID=UPI0030766025
MTDDEDLYRADDGAMVLSAGDREALIPTWVVTRDDLNRAERDNIAAGRRWARRRAFDVLDPDELMALHKRMFGAVWRWAGEPRRVETNIGRPDWWRLREYLQQLLGNIHAQVEAGGRDADEVAIDFHHQLVAIHVFPNGNGRHGRLAADILAVRLGREPFSWGRSDLVAVGDARISYRAALKAADAGDLAPLFAFARS